MAKVIVSVITFLLSLFVALAVRAFAIMGLVAISLRVMETGAITFWQALWAVVLLLLASFDMSAQYKGKVRF